MSHRKRKPAHANHERWLVSYADFITLLFAFFVVLYSSSQVDQRKVGKLAVAIQEAFQQLGVFPGGGTGSSIPFDPKKPLPPSAVQAIAEAERSAALARADQNNGVSAPENGDLAGLRQELEQALALEIQRNEVALRTEPDGLVVSLREIGFFESGSAEIRANSLSAFSRIASLLVTHNCRIRIEGHTDNVPIHNARFSDNWELSTARASELVRLLVLKYGFAPERLSAAGYAQYHPVAGNDTPETRAQNRRVDVVVLGRLFQQKSEAPPSSRSHDAAGPSPPSKPSSAAENSQTVSRDR
jgi:chemotaxis protein MotB